MKTKSQLSPQLVFEKTLKNNHPHTPQTSDNPKIIHQKKHNHHLFQVQTQDNIKQSKTTSNNTK